MIPLVVATITGRERACRLARSRCMTNRTAMLIRQLGPFKVRLMTFIEAR